MKLLERKTITVSISVPMGQMLKEFKSKFGCVSTSEIFRSAIDQYILLSVNGDEEQLKNMDRSDIVFVSISLSKAEIAFLKLYFGAENNKLVSANIEKMLRLYLQEESIALDKIEGVLIKRPDLVNEIGLNHD